MLSLASAWSIANWTRKEKKRMGNCEFQTRQFSLEQTRARPNRFLWFQECANEAQNSYDLLDFRMLQSIFYQTWNAARSRSSRPYYLQQGYILWNSAQIFEFHRIFFCVGQRMAFQMRMDTTAGRNYWKTIDTKYLNANAMSRFRRTSIAYTSTGRYITRETRTQSELWACICRAKVHNRLELT